MSIEDLIQLLQNRLTFVADERDRAVTRGDISYVEALDRDTAQTSQALTVLQTAVAA